MIKVVRERTELTWKIKSKLTVTILIYTIFFMIKYFIFVPFIIYFKTHNWLLLWTARCMFWVTTSYPWAYFYSQIPYLVLHLLPREADLYHNKHLLRLASKTYILLQTFTKINKSILVWETYTVLINLVVVGKCGLKGFSGKRDLANDVMNTFFPAEYFADMWLKSKIIFSS